MRQSVAKDSFLSLSRKGDVKMIYRIYSITCEENNSIYIGMSQEYEKRWRSHINQLRLGEHNNINLQKDWSEYGEGSFKFDIVSEFEDKDECMKQEIQLINNLEKDRLYNIVKDTSVGGDIFTNNPRKEEIRKQRVEQMSGKGNHQYGKAKTEKMINSVKEANSKKIVIDDIEYPSLTEASKHLGIGITTVVYRLKSNSKKFEKWYYLSA